MKKIIILLFLAPAVYLLFFYASMEKMATEEIVGEFYGSSNVLVESIYKQYLFGLSIKELNKRKAASWNTLLQTAIDLSHFDSSKGDKTRAFTNHLVENSQMLYRIDSDICLFIKTIIAFNHDYKLQYLKELGGFISHPIDECENEIIDVLKNHENEYSSDQF